MTWWIVAIVYITGVEEPRFVQMEREFSTKLECQQFYINDRSVQNDVLILYPNLSSHTLICMNDKQIRELTGEGVA